MTQTSPAIVLTLTGTGIAAVRDVREGGGRVIGVDDDPWRPGRYSRWLSAAPELLNLPLDAALVDALRRYAARTDTRPVVLPCSDPACEWVIEHKAALDTFAAVSAGYVDAQAGMLLDKLRFGDRCVAEGVDVPLTVIPRDAADVAAFVAEAGLPCIVKPREGHRWRQRLRGQKLLTPATRGELDHLLHEVIGDPTAVVLQELVPGPESELVVGAVLTDQSGAVRHVLTGRKVRQFPRDFGSGSLVRTESLPEVARLSAEVVAKLGYTGVCGTEFKRDPRSGALRLIEINPRPTLWFDLCRAAGSHIVQAHWRELAGEPLPTVAPQRDGVTWRYWTRDLIALGQAHRRDPKRLLGELWRTPRHDTLATMALNDPRTVVATLAHTAFQAVSHLKR